MAGARGMAGGRVVGNVCIVEMDGSIGGGTGGRDGFNHREMRGRRGDGKWRAIQWVSGNFGIPIFTNRTLIPIGAGFC